MPCEGSVGQGVTLSLSVDTSIGQIRTLQMPEWATDPTDFSSLSHLVWMCFLPGGLADPGSFNAEIYFNPRLARPTINAVQTATITFPIQGSGGVAGGTIIGSGFVNSLAFPNAAVSEPLLEGLGFRYDGNTVPPSFSKET